MKLPTWKVAMIFILTGLSACTTVQTHSEVKLTEPLATGEGVVLLADMNDLNTEQEYDDESVNNCLDNAMHDVNPRLRIVSAQKFRDSLYPYFSTTTTPHTTEEYQALLKKSLIRQRIVALSVRYLVILDKADTHNDYHGGMVCGGGGLGGGGAGGGCLGGYWWNRKTFLTGQIWDLKLGSSTGTFKTQGAGTGIVPAIGLPFPLYLPATESASCKELGVQLAKTLTKPR